MSTALLAASGLKPATAVPAGPAAAGYFSDANCEAGQYPKKTFASGRTAKGIGETGPSVPPVALQIDSPHGRHLLALGRWKSQGGYPTLTHGGLSLLEVLSPFVEISNT